MISTFAAIVALGGAAMMLIYGRPARPKRAARRAAIPARDAGTVSVMDDSGNACDSGSSDGGCGGD